MAEEHSRLSKDCAICMLPIDTQAQHSSLNVLYRTNYMVTPCHHIFHTDCLEKVCTIADSKTKQLTDLFAQ